MSVIQQGLESVQSVKAFGRQDFERRAVGGRQSCDRGCRPQGAAVEICCRRWLASWLRPAPPSSFGAERI